MGALLNLPTNILEIEIENKEENIGRWIRHYPSLQR